jgi:DNA-binding response OmpR family regulator
LLEANRGPIDLAVLDWNLGAGNDGLQLLEDLCVFNPTPCAWASATTSTRTRISTELPF